MKEDEKSGQGGGKAKVIGKRQRLRGACGKDDRCTHDDVDYEMMSMLTRDRLAHTKNKSPLGYTTCPVANGNSESRT